MDDAREVFKAAEENVDELGAAAPVYKEMEMGGKGDQSSSILAAAALTSAITEAHLRLKISLVPSISTLAQ